MKGIMPRTYEFVYYRLLYFNCSKRNIFLNVYNVKHNLLLRSSITNQEEYDFFRIRLYCISCVEIFK